MLLSASWLAAAELAVGEGETTAMDVDCFDSSGRHTGFFDGSKELTTLPNDATPLTVK